LQEVLVSFDILKTHASIGWDVDGTLVNPYNPAAAKRLHQFIFDHPEKRHCLVTFRTHDLLHALEGDLAGAGLRDMSIFDKIYSVPPDMWMQWAVVQQQRRLGQTRGKLLLAETAYMEWKGFICRSEGLTVLVDDDTKNTQRGCERFNVVLIDPATL